MNESKPPHNLRKPNAQRVKRHFVREELIGTQATRVIEKFGGLKMFLEALERVGRARNRTSIYRWNYPRDRGGCGGMVPTSAWPDIFLAARADGIILTTNETDPRQQQKLKKTIVALEDFEGNVRPYVHAAVRRKQEREARDKARRKKRQRRERARLKAKLEEQQRKQKSL